MEFRLGLDIGIASLGWGIVDVNDEIVDAGVRLFPEGGKEVNTGDRRAQRGARRLLRRRSHRLERAKKLLVEIGIMNSLEEKKLFGKITPYHLRVKGLREKLEEKELSMALLHLVKRRGLHNVDAQDSVDEKKGELSTKNIITVNEELLRDKYICEIQVERLEENIVDEHNGSVRGIKNRFKTSDYVNEATQLLETQKKYNNKITEEFISKYLELIEKRREYFDGPSKPSVFGWSSTQEWLEKLMGKCTYFPEEIRMIKHSYTSQLFNLLNDINNLTIKREENTGITYEEKLALVELFKKSKTVNLKKIASVLNVNEVAISGYRINKSEVAIFTPLESYIDINKFYPCDDRDKIDKISQILTFCQTKDEKIKELKELNYGIDEVGLDGLSDINKTGTHSLSKKAMDLIMEELLSTNKNQMELFSEKKLVPYKMDFRGMKKIPKKYIEEWILSSVVKRSLSQCINLINEVEKKYGTPKEIVIEMAREKNSDDKIKFIKELQKKNEVINKSVREILENRRVDGGMFEKLKYWHAQDGVCFYSGKKIVIDQLLANGQNYEIDHIIPRSISFDDSMNNKVLVLSEENQKKRNRTPYTYLSSGSGSCSYESYKARILENKNINKRKRANLLFEEELDKYALKFIERNLVDTRYATRELLNMLKRFYKDNEKDVKIKCINGSFTSQIRKQWKFSKERNVSHVHHAQDALIMLMGEKIVNNLRWVKRMNTKDSYDENTGEVIKSEILDDKGYKELFDYSYGLKVKQFDKYRYSHFVDTKPNRQLSNETIYGTREVVEIDKKGKEEIVEYYIGKQSNLYGKENKDIRKYFEDESKKEKLLMFHHDKKTLEKFEKVFEEYRNEKGNPFFAYFSDHGKYITKYAKKENGPPVLELKYRVKQLGSHLDLSHKYSVKNKKVVMLSIPSYRADFYKKGDNWKFVSLTYLMLRDKGKYYDIDFEKYEKSKERKGIDSDYEFQFSAYKGSILEIGNNESKEKIKFKGVNDDILNKVEVDLIDRSYAGYIQGIKELQEKLKKNPELNIGERFSEISPYKIDVLKSKEEVLNTLVSSTRKMKTIRKDVSLINKIHTTVLGVEYSSEENFISRIYK